MGNHIPAPQNRIPYPKDVWSPTGGWYANPKNWRRNTAFAFAFVIVSSALVFKFSADHEVRHTEPVHPIPSQRWEKQYRDKREER